MILCLGRLVHEYRSHAICDSAGWSLFGSPYKLGTTVSISGTDQTHADFNASTNSSHFFQYLDALSGVLDKAAAHCKAHKIDESVLLQMRVFPDMLPMANQVSIAIFFSGGTIAQLAGIEAPDFGTDNASFAGLKGRIAKAVEFIKGVTPEQLEGSEEREIELTQAGVTFNFTGLVFLLNHAMPQFHFHVTTAYNLLRHAGVEIGKRDFMGEYPN